MDWSKAKTILIIALLVTCLVLGGLLLRQKNQEKNNDILAASAAKEYLLNQGVSSICDIPCERPSLPVLFVNFFSLSSSANNIKLEEYKNIPVVYDAQNLSPYLPQLKSAGKTSGKVCTASSALLSACASLDDVKNLEVKSIKLVYYIEPSEVSGDSEDTAIPNWEITTSKGTYYINAFAMQ